MNLSEIFFVAIKICENARKTMNDKKYNAYAALIWSCFYNTFNEIRKQAIIDAYNKLTEAEKAGKILTEGYQLVFKSPTTKQINPIFVQKTNQLYIDACKLKCLVVDAEHYCRMALYEKSLLV